MCKLLSCFFALQNGDIDNSDQIFVISEVSIAAFLLFFDNFILLTVGIDLIGDYSREDFVNSRKRGTHARYLYQKLCTMSGSSASEFRAFFKTLDISEAAMLVKSVSETLDNFCFSSFEPR